MDIISNFCATLKPEYFEVLVNVPYIELQEPKQPQCIVQLLIANQENHFLVIKDIEKLKVKDASYLIKEYPKDCDYIILDLKKKIIYIVELKDTKRDRSSASLMSQLIAGEKWLSHILFCCKYEGDIFNDPEWKTKRIGIRHRNMRPSKTKDKNLKHIQNIKGRNMYRFTGKYLYLEYIK